MQSGAGANHHASVSIPIQIEMNDRLKEQERFAHRTISASRRILLMEFRRDAAIGV
jgi:hypothetical protein